MAALVCAEPCECASMPPRRVETVWDHSYKLWPRSLDLCYIAGIDLEIYKALSLLKFKTFDRFLNYKSPYKHDLYERRYPNAVYSRKAAE